jgi:hypothetical protein
MIFAFTVALLSLSLLGCSDGTPEIDAARYNALEQQAQSDDIAREHIGLEMQRGRITEYRHDDLQRRIARTRLEQAVRPRAEREERGRPLIEIRTNDRRSDRQKADADSPYRDHPEYRH